MVSTSPPAAADSARETASDIRNMAKEWSIIAKEMGKMRRLRYNFIVFGLKKLVEKYAQLVKA